MLLLIAEKILLEQTTVVALRSNRRSRIRRRFLKLLLEIEVLFFRCVLAVRVAVTRRKLIV